MPIKIKHSAGLILQPVDILAVDILAVAAGIHEITQAHCQTNGDQTLNLIRRIAPSLTECLSH
jgi:hypothetical protein